jgi:hypothetical protein
MAERVDNGYKRLFELRLLHHYWLDEGGKLFDSLPENDGKQVLLPKQRPPLTQECRLLSYDSRSFLTITPTATTERILKGSGCVCRNTALGCIVAIPSNKTFSTDALLEFVVTVKDAAFFNYTTLTLRPQKIYSFLLPSDDSNRLPTLYRYKENVPVLSNVTGATRLLNAKKSLFLSKEIPAVQNSDLVESLVLASGGLWQLTSDPPNPKTQQLNSKATDLPVFVHQADVPPIVPPLGLMGVPAKGIQLSNDIPDTVFALIQLSPLRNDDDDFSFIDKNTQLAKTQHPVFQIRFKNRATIWQYLKKENGALVSEEPEPLPLTYFGNAAGNKQKPFAGLVEARKSGDKITQLVSNIFI